MTKQSSISRETSFNLAAEPAPSFIGMGEAFWYWLKLGLISFGGPAGQIAIMHQDLVVKKRWISEGRFLHALNYCMVLPGPEAQQLATYIGWLMHRTWGGVMAGGLFVLPSFFILMALAWLSMAWGSVPAIAGMFYGIKPAVVAIVLFAAYRIGSRTLKNKLLWGIALAAFMAIFVGKLPFPAIVLAAAGLGLLGSRYFPQYFKSGAGHQAGHGLAAKALIDDDTPTPKHAMFNRRGFVRVLIAGVGCWLALILYLSLWFGWSHPLTQMGWFFTKAAMLTFGGAYAVLPYVYQGAVDHYHWLTPLQMIDGLALGETTPGPLVMVITYVGFVGGWVKQVFGPNAVLLSAFVAASVATFVTFLPSFVFIFLGGPFIETTHGNLSLTAPLTAITAAVVGVIVNLAAFFAYHVLWPSGFQGAMDYPSLVLTCLATWCLFKWKLNTIPVIVVSGLLGVLWALWG